MKGYNQFWCDKFSMIQFYNKDLNSINLLKISISMKLSNENFCLESRKTCCIIGTNIFTVTIKRNFTVLSSGFTTFDCINCISQFSVCWNVETFIFIFIFDNVYTNNNNDIVVTSGNVV